MTVAELIAELQKLGPDMTVFTIEGDCDEPYDFLGVSIQWIKRDDSGTLVDVHYGKSSPPPGYVEAVRI